MTSSPPGADGERRRCLTFLMNRDEYAVDLLRVKEILRYEGATRVPRVPSCVRGVVNLRGSVVPVIDLAAWFGMPEAATTPLTCLLLVEMAVGAETSVLGLVVDAVDQVLEVEAADVEPPPSFGTAVPPEYLLGMAPSGEAFAFLLDLDRVLAEGALLHGMKAGRETA